MAQAMVARTRGRRRWRAVAALRAGLVGVALILCGSGGAMAEGPLRVLLNWSPTSMFAAFYVAEDRGLYAKAGIAVALEHQGQSGGTLESSPFDLAVLSPGELIAARARGMKLKAVAALCQRSPIVFVSKAEYGITRPAQIVGQTVRTTAEMTPILNALLAGEGLAPGSWTPATFASDPALFLDSPARVWGVYSTGLAQQLSAAGHAINVIYPEDYGLGLNGSVVVVREDLLAAEHARVKAFVTATLDGLELAIETPDLAVAGTLARDPATRSGTERDRFLGAIPLFRGRGRSLGAMDAQTWANALAVAAQAGVATQAIQPADLFTTELLP
ncbi:ABC transporter substrate-binding protein [Zavarzinia sp. CC-PAN008]|uniref:ABC transporter substrate-binding protein n=1 Tax=Zavarzinia sp. CC-PAN008 TaxID=3243332 RepID=UPI003F744AE2